MDLGGTGMDVAAMEVFHSDLSSREPAARGVDQGSLRFHIWT